MIFLRWYRIGRKTIYTGLLLMTAALALAHGFPWPARAETSLPNHIISGYNGWYAPNEKDALERLEHITKRYLDPMAENEFTAYHVKIQGANKETIDLTDPAQMRRMRKLARAVRKRNLALLTYVYDDVNHGHRNPDRHADYPPVVRKDGTTVPDKFSLIHYPTWKMLFTEAFVLARASKELPIASVQIDVERIQPPVVSYDGHAWKRFSENQDLPAQLPAEKRHDLLKQKDLVETYERWYRNQMNKVARQFRDDLHEINPDLSLGIMPTKKNWLIWPFVRHLGTERAPAVIDHWGMYNGGGFSKSVRQAQRAVKQANPQNRFVPWFRPDSYTPEDIKVQAYHAIRKTDGYSMWHLGMLSSRSALPGSYTGTDYFRAFGEANRLALRDMKQERPEPSIPFSTPDPLTAPLPEQRIKQVEVPQLKPAGDGDGKPQWIPSRELRVFYVYARAGEDIRIDVRHLAGDQRPLSLQYALIDAEHTILRDEAVAPGNNHSFNVTAPHTGTYALIITGGQGGQAWYGVRILNDHMAMPAGQSTNDRVRLFMTGAVGGNTVDLYLTRTKSNEPARVHVRTGRGQVVSARLDDRSPRLIDRDGKTLTLSEGRSVHRLRLSPPDQIPEGQYVQGVMIQVSGAVDPHVSDHPSRRLLRASPSDN